MNIPMIRNALRALRTAGLIREIESPGEDPLYELAGTWPARWFRALDRGGTQTLR